MRMVDSLLEAVIEFGTAGKELANAVFDSGDVGRRHERGGERLPDEQGALRQSLQTSRLDAVALLQQRIEPEPNLPTSES